MFAAPTEIPGTFEWLLEQKLRSPPTLKDTGTYWSSLTSAEQDNLTHILRGMKGPDLTINANSNLVHNLNRWTDGNEWMMIEGGEHNGRWVNPRYPSTTYGSGRLKNIADNNYTYFPIGNSHTDPDGIACHYEINSAGTGYTVSPNKWSEAKNFRYYRRRRQWRHRRAQKRVQKRQGIEKASPALPGITTSPSDQAH